jgi:hypothetical protein
MLQRGGFSLRIPVVLAMSLAVGATPGAAQDDTLARLDGTVSESKNGRPLYSVMVAVRGREAVQVTDSAGRFSIVHLPPGRHTLRLAYQNRMSEDYDVVLRAGRTVELVILLDVGGVELAPVVVEAASQEWALSRAGFYARRGKGSDTSRLPGPAGAAQTRRGLRALTWRGDRGLCEGLMSAAVKWYRRPAAAA